MKNVKKSLLTLTFFLLFYSLNGLNMTYITIFFTIFFPLPMIKLQNDDKYQLSTHNKRINTTNTMGINWVTKK
jgi:hypothetical protein